MNEPLDARLDLDERAEVHETRNRAAHAVAGFVFFRSSVPRMGLQFLHADCDAVLVGIHVDDAAFDPRTGRRRVRRLVYAMTANLSDVQRRFCAADIYEGAVI